MKGMSDWGLVRWGICDLPYLVVLEVTLADAFEPFEFLFDAFVDLGLCLWVAVRVGVVVSVDFP